MLQLPNVTLTLYEGRAYELAAAALHSMMARVRFAEVIVYSDKDLRVEGTRWIETPAGSREIADEMLMQYSGSGVETSHYIQAQWDSGVVDPDAWTDEFLEYDYIGAPWPWYREYMVGNGGFALYSVKLREYLVANRDRFPVFANDNRLSRVFRPTLEEIGFKWAPVELAQRFAFERTPPMRSFGFHGCYNMPLVMPPEEFLPRIAMDDWYLRRKPEWTEVAKNAGIAP